MQYGGNSAAPIFYRAVAYHGILSYICRMNEKLLFRRARPADTERIMEIIRQAQAQMRALGSLQWQDGYPARTDIDNDIARGYGYVFEKSGTAEEPAAAGTPQKCDKGRASGAAIAYGAVVFDGEPAYDAIDGQWLTDEPYVLVHRIAVADGERGRGVAAEFLHRVETLAQERGVKAFRIDTNFDNQTMLRLLERTGFTYCGKVVYRSGERLAYEKRI